MLIRVATVLAGATLLPSCMLSTPTGGADWAVYGGNPAGQRYSPLDQINRQSVKGLQQVWRFDTGPGGLQTSPLVIDGVLYAMTPTQGVIALDGATGEKLWEHIEPGGGGQPVRGLTYWTDGTRKRLFTSHGTDLIALDATTGKLAPEFGEGGHVDLRVGLADDPTKVSAFLTSPGIVFSDLIITGFRTSESRPAAPGKVRAYDVRSGALRWTFDLVGPGETAGDQSPGGYNAWAGMVVDTRRGIVFAPTGSASNDFYGGDRPGSNLYANSLVALDARTGKRKWHFQFVHHDILDRDVPSPPVLLTVRRDRRMVDAVAQTTKQGFVFLFERETGKPLFPIEERPVPQSDVPGETSWPTQPHPLAPAPYARQRLTREDVTNRTPEARAAAQKAFDSFHVNGPFAPLRVGQQTLIFPGFDGGAEWGGPAVDPEGILYVNSNEMAWRGGLAVRETGGAAKRSHGETLYQDNCSMCHGDDRSGSPPIFPDLRRIGDKRSAQEIAAIIKEGVGRMPGFPQIGEDERAQIIAYLRGEAKAPAPPSAREEVGGDDKSIRYRFTGYQKFVDADGYPAIAPPWGTLNAIDMNTGKYLWRIPLGEHPELVAKGMRNTGSENYGGPLVTAGGLVIIGATLFDSKLRAFDRANGRLLWETTLPYSGMATPITYKIAGRQYIAIAISNSRNPKATPGSAYVAFALPR